jgi:PLP dependent protein
MRSGLRPGRHHRSDELAAALTALRQRIEHAVASAGRKPEEIRIVAVTKSFPVQDAALLADLGIDDLGENRDQEASAKIMEFRRLRPHAAPRWHMVGRLQRNKARSVLGWADVVQSVDSQRLADALHAAVRTAVDAGRRQGPLDVLLQASLDGDLNRGGCPLAELPGLADHVACRDGLRLRGLMAVAPLGADPDRAFDALRDAFEALVSRYPQATELSAGMTDDLEAAIRHGSTCVRVGTALLGDRPLASP